METKHFLIQLEYSIAHTPSTKLTFLFLFFFWTVIWSVGYSEEEMLAWPQFPVYKIKKESYHCRPI